MIREFPLFDSRSGRSAHCITPPGRSAIATIHVTGCDAITDFDAFFFPKYGKSLAAFCSNKVVFGRWENADGSAEDLVVTPFGEGCLQVHCHGGVAAVESVLETLQLAGFKPIESAQQRRGFFAESELDREILEALAESRTRKTANQFLRFWSGCFRDRILQLGKSLKDSPEQAIDGLQQLQKSYQVGKGFCRPFQVVFSGQPNVGKSSLCNSILGFERSIVEDRAGTTRDVVMAVTTWDQWQFQLTDTAGIQATSDEIESKGIDQAEAMISRGDIWVWVIDAKQFNGSDLSHLLPVVPETGELDSSHRPDLIVINKIDTMDRSARNELHSISPQAVFTDALHGEGIEVLMGAIRKIAVPLVPENETAILFTSRQFSLVEQALDALRDRDLERAHRQLLKIID
ncbi:GTP-binding protein [Pirellulaceae bacterium]|nr:GTP-binding protein [Pirellulaceae bacterium]